jgi:hypothetical protein
MRLNELSREYEAQRYPPTRRLDLQNEGPETARQRALRYIQSFAHEQPGADLLLIVERGRPGRKGPIRTSIEKLLDELKGGLIEWWQPFAEGSLAVRVAADPHRWQPRTAAPPDPAEGRSDATAGRAYLPPEDDIPEELVPIARRAAEMRRMREGQAVGLGDVVLREIWIEAQTAAFTDRIGWDEALYAIAAREEEHLLRSYED